MLVAQSSEYYKQALEEYEELKKERDQEAWDKRIDNTGCYVENMALRLCHADTGDWRKCLLEMELFKNCWKEKGNVGRVHTVDREV
ncbi:HCL073Cp [Eremothecium sinecaudum]|uniref:HCL073Cp n=1 Tax=Eremothecium sinecaudum TaxID=45286 RepID=A0A0X8HRG7_9SACH|nr:HCL073Cp [Eremothecium sinecaudum]AMD20078.1 HCL073Cp [Eremothecium sinecaudum]